MNPTLHSLATVLNPPTPPPQMHWTSSLLAQTNGTVNGREIYDNITANLGTSLSDLIRALIILVVGLLIAWIASAIVKGILNRTSLDNRLARWLTGDSAPGAESPPVEKWIAGAVFWVIFIFTIVAFLQALQLTAVSEPLNDLLRQVVGYLPELAGALILIGIAWLIATLVKLIVTRSLRAIGLDERLGEHTTPSTSSVPPADTSGATTTPAGTPSTPTGAVSERRTTSSSQFSLSETIGSALYWFIFLLFLPAILNTLGLQGTLEPVQELLNQILSILPNILAAILIGAAGWLVAQIVRRIVTNFLTAAGTDRIGSRFGLNASTDSRSLSWLIGTVVYVLILIPTAIAALNALEIDAISVPAISMLEQVLDVLPQIFTAALVLIAAYMIGHFVAELVTSVLSSVGFNNLFEWLGFRTRPEAPPAQPSVMQQPEPIRPAAVPTKTPSEIVGVIVWVGIMLFATVAAVNILNIPALTALVTGIVIISGRILAGLIVFAVGLYFANLAFSIIVSSGGRQARILGQTARVAIIALVSAMALQQMGVATSIVNLAFGLLVGAIAVAIAIAFGLGGRDVASEQIREWLASFKDNRGY